MEEERGNPAETIVKIGIGLVTIGLVMQTFADTAGLYCFGIGVLFILVYLILKVAEFVQSRR